MTTGRERHGHVTGTGPGVVTADGCPVDLWALLPAGATPTIIHEAIPPGTSVLDLGAGAGRLADPLASLGHTVVAVDESAAMLARVRHVRCVCSAIEDLVLDTTFDVVLLASSLVNTPNRQSRRALLSTCRRHVRPGGQVLVQRYLPGWAEATDGRTAQLGARVTYAAQVVARHGEGRYTVAATCRSGDREWSQRYTMQELGDQALDQDLRAVGLSLQRWISDDGTWVAATVRSRDRVEPGSTSPSGVLMP